VPKDGKFGTQAVFDNSSQCAHDQLRQRLLSTPTGERSRSGTDESYRSAAPRISFRERPHASDLLNRKDFKAGRNHVLTLMRQWVPRHFTASLDPLEQTRQIEFIPTY